MTAASDATAPLALSAIHDFAAKLRHPDVLPRLAAYVRWQAFLRGTRTEAPGGMPSGVPEYAPVSINLDITTACNFACDHCVDADILNSRIRYRHEQLLASLELMAGKGLRSVIVIGGGEPTVYPRLEETVRRMKSLGLQVGIVTNGSRMRRIAAFADCLDEADWVRLSLDAGSDAVFQAMHRPKQPISLEAICDSAREIRALAPRFKLGYSYVVTWRGASIHDASIVENLHEMPLAAERARASGFDYIAFKPFLTRARANRAEIVDLSSAEGDLQAVLGRMREAVREARRFETPQFRVYAATNLKAILRDPGTHGEQPHECHMQFFRQVLSPLGLFNCPVYRNEPRGRIGGQSAYASEDDFRATLAATARILLRFDAASECRHVTCLYHDVNWWIEDLIAHPDKLASLGPVAVEVPDFFL